MQSYSQEQLADIYLSYVSVNVDTMPIGIYPALRLDFRYNYSDSHFNSTN